MQANMSFIIFCESVFLTLSSGVAIFNSSPGPLGSQGDHALSSVVVVVVYIVYTFQSSSLKQLGQSNSNFMWSILNRKGKRKFV